MTAAAPKPAMSAVDVAQAAAKQAGKKNSRLYKVGAFLHNNVLSYLLPKKKTLVRAILFSLLGTLPFLLILLVKLPHIMLPFFLLVGGTIYALGGAEDITKQARWMKRMSGRGPIFWALAWAHRMSVRVGRKMYGTKLDVLPLAPKALGTETRGAVRAKLKWLPTPSSSYSTELYEVHIRPRALANGDDEHKGWVKLADDLSEVELLLKPLQPGTEYDVRVRAVNTKGASEWRECAFTTKDQPVLSADGERAGGAGPGYTWAQHLKDESLLVTLGGLPSSTRGKQLEVKVLPGSLEVRREGSVLLSGELFGGVRHEEVEWELTDASGKSGGRELSISLIKSGKPGGPFWPHLLKGHPEIDVSTLKRKEKDIDELMAELNTSEALQGMGRVQELKKEMNM